MTKYFTLIAALGLSASQAFAAQSAPPFERARAAFEGSKVVADVRVQCDRNTNEKPEVTLIDTDLERATYLVTQICEAANGWNLPTTTVLVTLDAGITRPPSSDVVLKLIDLRGLAK